MKLKNMLLVFTILLLVFISSCYGKKDSGFKDLILSKDPEYDFLKDESFMEKLNDLGYRLTDKNINEDYKQFTIGHLDGDNIPELLIFKERGPGSNEKSSLNLYQFNGSDYTLSDRVIMEFDNTNYGMVIGRIQDDTQGLFMTNQVGAHSGYTYGYILEDGCLKSILNPDKTPLLSTYTQNEIKDVNSDGILNYSIYILDPKSQHSTMYDSEKISLWYQWDGRDGAYLIRSTS